MNEYRVLRLVVEETVINAKSEKEALGLIREYDVPFGTLTSSIVLTERAERISSR